MYGFPHGALTKVPRAWILLSVRVVPGTVLEVQGIHVSQQFMGYDFLQVTTAEHYNSAYL